MRSLKFKIAALVLTLRPQTVLSQTDNGTIGGLLSNLLTDIWQPILLLVVILCAVIGLVHVVKGMVALVRVTRESSGPEGYGRATLTIVGGVILLVIPDVAGLGMMSILGNVSGGGTLGSSALDYREATEYGGDLLSEIMGGTVNPGPVEPCLSFTGREKDNVVLVVQCMAKNLALNVVPIASFVLFALAFIIGFAGLALNIAKFAQSTGPRNQSLLLVPICANVLLMNASFLFKVMAETLFTSSGQVLNGNILNANSSLLAWSATEGEIQPWCELLSRSSLVLAFFGILAFVRGLYMLKAVSEHGRQCGSYGIACVFVVSGLMLANIKLVVNVFGGTFGIGGNGFCS